MKIIRLITIVTLLAVSTQAQIGYLNYDKMHLGQEVRAYSARMLGLAGSGLALKGALGQGINNPALIVSDQKGLALQGGFAVNKLLENREYPYYDSFVGFNDYGSYAYNANWYYNPYFAARFAHKTPFGDMGAVQVGVTPFLDFRYDYTEEVRDPVNKSDQLLGYNSIWQTGVLNLGYVAVGYQILPKLSAGLSVGLLWGSIDSTMQIEPKAGAYMQRTINRRSRSLKGQPVLVNLGLHYQLTDRFGLAYSVRLPYRVQFDGRLKMSGDTTATRYDETMTYPLRMGAGIDYRFQNILQARVLLDFYYEFWDQFKDNRLNTIHYRNTYTIRAGIEHIFFDKLPFRVGFAFNQLPQNPDLTKTLLTIGTGWKIGPVTMDGSAGIVHQQFFQPDIFPDTIYGLPARTDMDRVNWTNYFLRLDFSYHFFE